MAGCRHHELFCCLWSLCREQWNTNDGNRTNPSRIKMFFSSLSGNFTLWKTAPFPFGHILVVRKILLRYLKVDPAVWFVPPSRWKGCNDSAHLHYPGTFLLLPYRLLETESCIIKSWVFLWPYLFARVIEEVFLVIFHNIRIWVDAQHIRPFFLAFMRSERCAKHISKQVRLCKTLQSDFYPSYNRSEIKYLLRREKCPDLPV